MKASKYHRHGSPDVLELQDIDQPVVNDDEVLKRLAYLGPLVASFLLHFLWKPLRFFPEWWIGPAVGLPLVVVGILLLAWAIRTMVRAGEDPDPERPTTAIVANGPYAFSRNPIYVSFNAVYVGIALGRTRSGRSYSFRLESPCCSTASSPARRATWRGWSAMSI